MKKQRKKADTDVLLGRLKHVLKEAGQDGWRVKVGVLGSDSYPGEGDKPGLTVIQLATIHEYGSPKNNIPERSFIRGTKKVYKQELDKIITQLAKGIVQKKIETEKALGILGEKAVTFMKKMITEGKHLAPNAPRTIARKGSSRPLIDTGRLLGSIAYEVSTKAGK